MTFIIFFLFSSMITLSVSQRVIPWSTGRCLTPNPVTNFEFSKFFSGRWFAQKSYGNLLFQGSGLCPSIVSKQTDDKIDIITYNFNTLFNRYDTLEGEVSLNYLDTQIGYFLIKFLGFGILPINVPMYVIGTDNENWAVIYSCTQQFIFKSEMSFAITRNRTNVSEDILKIIDQTIVNNGLKLVDYIQSKNIGCGPNEPEILDTSTN